MTIIISGDTGVPVSPVTGTLAVLNGGTGVTTSTGSGANVLGTSPSISGAVMSTMASSVITSGTAVASTSGTSIDFTGIPSWVKRITVMLSGVSTNGASQFIIQLGDSGGVENSGYLGGASRAATHIAQTTGFGITAATGASSIQQGSVTVSLLNSSTFTWTSAGNLWDSYSVESNISAGGKSLSATLDRIRITTVNGTDTFDAGSINILYE